MSPAKNDFSSDAVIATETGRNSAIVDVVKT
jgi:hypothetical protein